MKFILLILLLSAPPDRWPSILVLPDYYAGGDTTITREVQRCWLEQAGGDSRLAMRLHYECLIEWYAEGNDNDGIIATEQMLFEMKNSK